MRTIRIISVLILFLVSCEQEITEPYEVFSIKKGTHGPPARIQTLQSSSLSFKAVFNESAIYQTKDPINQHDANKLLGFSDCNVHHQDHSARFGWRWLDSTLEILAYCYVDGERIIRKIGNVEIDQPSDFEILLTESAYKFRLDQNPEVAIERTNDCDYGLYYMLFPYFGGDEVAPHDISISILIK